MQIKKQTAVERDNRRQLFNAATNLAMLAQTAGLTNATGLFLAVAGAVLNPTQEKLMHAVMLKFVREQTPKMNRQIKAIQKAKAKIPPMQKGN